MGELRVHPDDPRSTRYVRVHKRVLLLSVVSVSHRFVPVFMFPIVSLLYLLRSYRISHSRITCGFCMLRTPLFRFLLLLGPSAVPFLRPTCTILVLYAPTIVVSVVYLRCSRGALSKPDVLCVFCLIQTPLFLVQYTQFAYMGSAVLRTRLSLMFFLGTSAVLCLRLTHYVSSTHSKLICLCCFS